MFKYYILSRIKSCPYIYNLGCAGFDGKLELRENLFLYGPGLGVELLSDIKDKTDIKVPVDFMMMNICGINQLGNIFDSQNPAWWWHMLHQRIKR